MKVRHRQTYYAMSLLTADLLSILAALHFSFWIRFQSGWFPLPHGIPNTALYFKAFIVITIVTVFIFRMYGLYVESKISTLSEEIFLVLKAATATTLFLLAASFFFRDAEFSRGYLPIAWATVVLFAFLARYFVGLGYVGYRRKHRKLNEVLAVGANRVSARYAVKVLREPRLCTQVVGILDARYPSLKRYKRLPVLGRPEDFEKALNDNPHVNEVVVTTPDVSHERVIQMMTLCEKNLVSFKWLPDILGIMATQMKVHYEFGVPFLRFKESPLADWENRLLKWFMDTALSGAALAVLSPVFALIAIAVRMDSRGPIFYKQERVGEDGRIFTLFKFRTMRPDAESQSGPVWAKEQDNRRTRIGSFLRQTNLDELPQLWNVFRGDMSLVGPRPERPHFVGQFREDVPRYMGRHRIKSGITGWAQVNGLRGNTSIEERTKYDLYYIENWSIFFDFKILFMTLFAFKNAY